MAFKRKSSAQPEATQAPANHQQKIAEQIERLEGRHRALLEETGAELAELKRELAAGQNIEEHVAAARQPLLSEIANLRSAVTGAENDKHALKSELERLQREYQDHYSELQSALGSLGKLVEKDAEPVAVKAAPLPVVTDENLEALLAEFSAPEPVAQASPAPEAPPVVAAIVEEKPRKEKREKKPRSFAGLRRLAIRTVAFALVATGGWAGLKKIQSSTAESGQVAGASTLHATKALPEGEVDPAEKYKESYSIVAFSGTEWETYTDIDFGISVRWPKNATSLSKTVGSNNIWFLRFNGYLMKITKEDTLDTLDAWWAKTSGFYTEGNTITKGTFKNRVSWVVTPLEKTNSSGTTYIFGTKTGVMQVWIKNEDPLTDDGQRLTKMVESISFTP